MANKNLYVFILLLSFVMGCTPKMAEVLPEAPQLKVPTVKKADAGFSADRLQRIDNFLEKELIANKIPGVVTLIKRKGVLAYNKAHGPKGPDDPTPIGMDEVFYIQSMTKPIVSVAFMMLYEEGHFQLNDPVSKYIPAFADMKVASSHEKEGRTLIDAERPITIAHALSHTAGLSHGLGPTELEQEYLSALYFTQHKNIEGRVKALANMPLVGQPGEQWYYSASPDILALLIEKFSGMTCAEYLQQKIFDPLSMKDTGYNMKAGTENRQAYLYMTKEDGTMAKRDNQTPKNGHTIYGGTHGLYSTAGDYMKFAEMLLNGAKANGKVFLGKKTLELMTTNFLKEGQSAGPGQGFGLGFGINEDLATSGNLGSQGTYYWGGAYNTYFFIDPTEEMIGVMMMQFAPYTDFYSQKFRQLAYQAIVD